MLIIFVNPLVLAPAQREARAIVQQPGHGLVKRGFDEIVGVQNVQIIGLAGQPERAVEIRKHAIALAFGNADFTGKVFEIADDFQRAVRGPVVKHDHAVRPDGLAGDGFQRLPDEILPVAHGHGRDDPRLHKGRLADKFSTARRGCAGREFTVDNLPSIHD